MTKRRSIQPRKLRDRRAGQSPYRKYNKSEFKYAHEKKAGEAGGVPAAKRMGAK